MSSATDLEHFLLEKIPLSAAMGVRVEGCNHDALVLVAPLEPNHNHLNTAFGGSLHAILTLSCYAWLWMEVQDPSAHIVVRESSISYLRPVKGELRAVCRRPDAQAVAQFQREFAARRKARISLAATMEEEGQLAVRYSGRFVAVG